MPGKDKITVYTDTDGDGVYDAAKDVITGLNIATAVATGRGPSVTVSEQGTADDINNRPDAPLNDTSPSSLSSQPSYGIYVLNPPYLLFYPDADRDDVPDADPVVCLAGFGLEDTHSVASSLRWGPDGWLYGANGSTSTGNVSSAVTKNVHWEGQCIWRFHPETHVFEIFAEGGGNTFSSEIDSKGRVFSGTNYGDTRGMYYPQGSYAVKGWGKHGPLTNPYAFGYFVHMKHEGEKDRFPQTFVIYEGGALPAMFRGNVIAANALHNVVYASEMMADGSTFRTIDRPPVVTTPDRWFRPVCVEVGPDGGVYLADWYDTRLTHVDPRDNWHKTSGRVYRLSSRAPKPTDGNPWAAADLMAMSDSQLIELFAHPNKWWRQTAARVLGDRLNSSPSAEQTDDTTSNPQAESSASQLIEIATTNDDRALEAVWALNLAGQFDFALASQLLAHPDEHVRRWTVRLLGDRRRLNDALGIQLAELAKSEPYVQVRSQLASSAKRFETKYALNIIRELLLREEDASDPHQPLLLWWALEAHCGDRTDMHVRFPIPDSSDAADSRAHVLALIADPALWDVPMVRETILARLMQRFAMDESTSGGASSAGLEACAELLARSPSPEHTARLMTGFLEAYQGREIKGLPASLAAALADYQRSLGESDVALALRLGDKGAVDAALKFVRDESADLPQRLTYIEILGQINHPPVVPPLLALLGSSSSAAVKRAAMQALINYDDPGVGQTICDRYQSTLPDEHDLRSTAHRVLASRAVWTRQFLNELTSHRIKRDTIPLDIVQQMRLHDDAEIQSILDQLWGRTRSTPEEKLAQADRLRQLIIGSAGFTARETDDGRSGVQTSSGKLTLPNPHRGRELFKQHCGTC
ncbi:MAG: HEAT repeat domain-containing protein, partial [Planctomycetaceae bacterium]|nr:HEAT repeat domain-containing protein [Planctomycetaceae bacterium]